MSTPITDITLTDVRTFSGEQRAHLSKMTLLVGENSVGKSTLLGCLYALGRLAAFNGLDDRTNFFNENPFCMGSFDTIARSGCTAFRVAIGLECGPFRHLAIEFARNADASLKETTLELQLSGSTPKPVPTLTIVREAHEGHPERWCVDGPAFRFCFNQSEVSHVQFTTWLSRSIAYGQLPFSGNPTEFRRRVDNHTLQTLAEFSKFVNFFRNHFRTPRKPPQIIPIPVRGLVPRRVYDSIPLGGLSSQMDIGQINDAGSKLGLFKEIDVRQLPSNEFEILVDVSGSGSFRNLSDVGYGIASLLPYLAAVESASQSTLFLLQQPEVHVHPSAQAELVKMMVRSDHTFVVETHSDHIIAWLRILVKEQLLAPSDASIIYLEPIPEDDTATCLHQIFLDRRANLSGQPRSYRQFFSRETARLLGIST